MDISQPNICLKWSYVFTQIILGMIWYDAKSQTEFGLRFFFFFDANLINFFKTRWDWRDETGWNGMLECWWHPNNSQHLVQALERHFQRLCVLYISQVPFPFANICSVFVWLLFILPEIRLDINILAMLLASKVYLFY